MSECWWEKRDNISVGWSGGGREAGDRSPLSPLSHSSHHTPTSATTPAATTTTARGEDGGRLGCNLAITLLLNMDHINSTPAPVPQYFPGISKVFTIFREGLLAESAYSEIGMLVQKVNCLLMVCFYQRSLKPHNAMMNLIKLGI